MNRAQRHVFVIGLGVVCAIAAWTTNHLIVHEPGGWFMYQPNAEPLFSDSSESWIWRSAAVWVGAVVVWTIAACVIYRNGNDNN